MGETPKPGSEFDETLAHFPDLARAREINFPRPYGRGSKYGMVRICSRN